MQVTKRSMFSGVMHTLEIDITPEQLAEMEKPLQERRFVQDICPSLSASDREFLVSGCTPEEWKEMFGEEE